MGAPWVTPATIFAGTPTTVTVTILITDPRLIPGSVNLQRLDRTGKVVAVLGALNDTGLDGDAVAGDQTFTIQTVVREPSPGRMFLRVTAALQGVVRRVSSAVVALEVE